MRAHKRHLLIAALCALFVTGCAASLKKDLVKTQQDLATCKQDLDASKARLAQFEDGMGQALSAKDLADRRMKAYEAIARKLRGAFDAGTLKIVLKNGRMVVLLPNQILFDFGKAKLKPEGEEMLTKLAAALQDVKDREFLVAGHTDNTPVRKKSKTYKSNWELSTLRSLTVISFLQARGTNPVQLAATGYGEHHPEVDNATEKGRAQNRRTELIIMPKVSEIPELPTGDFPVKRAKHARRSTSR